MYISETEILIRLAECLILPLDLISFTLVIGWCIYFIVTCHKLYKEYKTCKQTPVLHPLYSVFYNQQLSAFKFYRIFRIVTLVSLFFILLAENVFFISGICRIVFYDTCYIHFDKNISVPMSMHTKYNWLIEDSIDYFGITSGIIYSISLCFPLCGITLIPIILKCVKRCREKEGQYRYNYDKLEPLLKS